MPVEWKEEYELGSCILAWGGRLGRAFRPQAPNALYNLSKILDMISLLLIVSKHATPSAVESTALLELGLQQHTALLFPPSSE